MSKELKPCPFCGEMESLNVRAIHTHGRYCADMYCIECRRCLYCTMNFDTKDELYEFWNTRPAEDALKAELEELRYIVEQFKKWSAEGGCPNSHNPDFPCWWERNQIELELEDYCTYEDEVKHGCWVEYYRWKYRQEKEKSK